MATYKYRYVPPNRRDNLTARDFEDAKDYNFDINYKGNCYSKNSYTIGRYDSDGGWVVTLSPENFIYLQDIIEDFMYKFQVDK